MSGQINADLIANSAGTGAPSFPFGFNGGKPLSSTTPGAPVVLTAASNDYQALTPSADITLTLPTTSVIAGRKFTIANLSTQFSIQVLSSNGSLIRTLLGASSEFISLVATPVAAADWLDLLTKVLILRNPIINANFDIWQRGTSFVTPGSGSLTADRWGVDYDGTIGAFTASQQAFALGQGVVPNEPTFFYRWNQTSAGSGSTFRRVRQRIESVRAYAGKHIILSFWAKADVVRSVSVALRQNFGTGGSPSADVVTSAQTANLGTGFQQFLMVFSIPSIAGKTLGSGGNDFLELQINLPVNTLMTIDLAQLSVTEGTIPAPFQLSGGDMEADLERCQRYYQQSLTDETWLFPVSSSTQTNQDTIHLLETMRATPTVVTTKTSGTEALNGAASTISKEGFVQAFAGAQFGIVTYNWTADAEL